MITEEPGLVFCCGRCGREIAAVPSQTQQYPLFVDCPVCGFAVVAMVRWREPASQKPGAEQPGQEQNG